MACRPFALAAAAVVSVALGLGLPTPATSAARTPAHAARSRARVAPESRPIPAGQYKWYVPRRKAPLSIAAENRLPGTLDWRLAGAKKYGGEATGNVEGYVSTQAPQAGQFVTIFISAPGASAVHLHIYRAGWYGGDGGRLMMASGRLKLSAQPPCFKDSVSGKTECDWKPTLTFHLPSDLTSGVYIVKMNASNGSERDCIFIVRPASPPKVLVELPAATWQAYNFWGGNSLYPLDSIDPDALTIGTEGRTQGYEVSFDRPYQTNTGAGEFLSREVALVRFLERYGYAVGYTADFSVAQEPDQLRGVRVLIDDGHSEYWSQGQYEAWIAARERGTSELFLSSDTLAWRVRYSPAGPHSSERGTPNHIVTSYKQYEAEDPDKTEPTGYFPLGGAPLTGSAYDGCITPRTNPTGFPDYYYYRWRPSPSLSPSWLFAGTGLTATSEVAGIGGYELDQRTAFTPAGTQTIGETVGVSCRLTPHTGETGESTLYTAHSGAIVFAAGMLGWIFGLEPVRGGSADMPTKPSRAIVRMTRNLIARGLVAGAKPPTS